MNYTQLEKKTTEKIQFLQVNLSQHQTENASFKNDFELSFKFLTQIRNLVSKNSTIENTPKLSPFLEEFEKEMKAITQTFTNLDYENSVREKTIFKLKKTNEEGEEKNVRLTEQNESLQMELSSLRMRKNNLLKKKDN
jgi:predicted nucleotide-binding protein (sugar kinase/HSP70/actin superfamily)